VRTFTFGNPLRILGIFSLSLVCFLTLSELSYYYRHAKSSPADTRVLAEHSSLDLISLPNPESAGQADLAQILIATADFLNTLSTVHHLHSLKGLSDDIRVHASQAEKSSLVTSATNYLRKRGLLDDQSGAVSGLLGGSAGSSITDSLTSALTGLLPSVDSLAVPAQYLGDGLGRGAATGLNLSSNVASPAGVKAAAASPTPTGINAVADNLGFGSVSPRQ
jgi:hypothetical protein